MSRPSRGSPFSAKWWWVLYSVTLKPCHYWCCRALTTATSNADNKRASQEWPWRFAVTQTYPHELSSSPQVSRLNFLQSTFADFPSASQARRAIKYGEILALPSDDVFESSRIYDTTTSLSNTSHKLTPNHRVYRVTRLDDDNFCYPIKATKYVYPPSSLLAICATVDLNSLVIYQNDEMAVLNKPEGLTTIDTANDGNPRNDLQSILPFILSPPPPNKDIREQNAGKQGIFLPRPVHRLDRGTSGLLLVAKSQSAMRRFSALFADRKIQKTYTAVVFGMPKDLMNQNQHVEEGGVVDYPIDGKPAVTEWKLMESNGSYSRLELRPLTGRYHQLRLHLAYCLGTPIVGDVKYDLVGDSLTEDVVNQRKAHRDKGLHLCCHALEFDYPLLLDTNSISKDHILQRLISPSVKIWQDNHDGVEQSDVLKMEVSIEIPEKMLNAMTT